MGYRDEARFMILKYGRRHQQKKTFFAELFSVSKCTESPLFILLKVALLKVIFMLPHCKFSSLLFIRSQPKQKNKEKAFYYYNTYLLIIFQQCSRLYSPPVSVSV
jgi:hypothetical protein